MEAGIDLGFTALMAAAVSGGKHRDRASRPQKELYYDIVGPLLNLTRASISKVFREISDNRW